jgi:Na+-driven multidrug efflux pump
VFLPITRFLEIEKDRALLVVRLALPVMGSMLVQTFLNLFDTAIIGLLPEEYSISGQAALGYSVILHWLVGGFASCISVGTQAMTARRYGEGDKEAAGKVLFNALFLALVIGTFFSVVGMFSAKHLFRLVSSNEHVLEQGVPYVTARLAGILAMVGTLVTKAFFDGLGKTHYHLFVAIVMNVLNVLLALFLVFGFLGFPRMFVFGAGLAAVLASYVGLFLILGITLLRRYRHEFKVFHLRNFDLAVQGSILRLSLPSGVATVVVMTGFLLFFKWVGMIDEKVSGEGLTSFVPFMHELLPFAVSQETFHNFLATRPPIFEAATKVIIDLLSISFMPCIGLGVATATLVSQSLGAKKPKEAERFGWTAVKIAVIFTGVFAIFKLLLPDLAMSLFTHDVEVINCGRGPLRLIASGEWLMGFALVLAQALFGAGASRYVMKVELVMHTFCLIPLSYVLGLVLDLKLLGIWTSALLYLLGLAVAMTGKFAGGEWKKILI